MSVSALRRSCIRAISATDVPSNKQLDRKLSPTEEIRQQIGADSSWLHADRGTPEHGRRSADLPCMLRQPLPNGSTETGYQRSSSKADSISSPFTAQTPRQVRGFCFLRYFDVMFAYNSIKTKDLFMDLTGHHLFQRLHQHSDPGITWHSPSGTRCCFRNQVLFLR